MRTFIKSFVLAAALGRTVLSSAYAETWKLPGAPSWYFPGATSGVALDVLIAAQVSKTEICKGSKLSADLIRTCRKLVVPVVSEDTSGDLDTFFLINLVCPQKTGDGTLEVIKKNKNGVTGRSRTVYVSNRPTSHTIAAAENGKSPKDFMSLDFTTERDPEKRDWGKRGAAGIESVKRVICEGKDKQAQKIYYDSIDANRASLNPRPR